jgi:hypothetical protein
MLQGLTHHVNVDPLRESIYGLKRKAAPGVDGMTWKEYETGLEEPTYRRPTAS